MGSPSSEPLLQQCEHWDSWTRLVGPLGWGICPAWGLCLARYRAAHYHQTEPSRAGLLNFFSPPQLINLN